MIACRALLPAPVRPAGPKMMVILREDMAQGPFKALMILKFWRGFGFETGSARHKRRLDQSPSFKSASCTVPGFIL